MDWKNVSDFLQQGGLLAGTLIILYAGYKGWWIWGWQHRQELSEVKRERDALLRLALKGTSLAEILAKVPPETPDADKS